MLSGLAVVAGTLGWFVPLATITTDDNPLSGSSSGAYFAYGNGSPTTTEHPENRVYGITTPRHLYNLAWLQYLGIFNAANENGKQYYFELADNIDMTGWTLPPIGTEDNPFIGNFNGNGYVIKGLTVSNKFSDFQRHPAKVTLDNFEQPHIMGFFGVVGDYNGTFASTSEYTSAANEFSNTGLTGLTIKTYLKDSLMGVAAGYVDANMQNVAVDASTIDIDNNISESTTSYGGFTDNISDFSLVGYTTKEKQIRQVDETIYDVNVSSNHHFNATDTGAADGWGGSINMMSMFERLTNIRGRATDTNFVYRTTTSHQANGTTSNATSTNSDAILYTSNNQIGNFHYTYDSTSYMYLGGGTKQVDKYFEYVDHEAFYISDGTHYLHLNNTTIQSTTDENDATYFAQDDNGRLYTLINNTQYFLRNNNGTLQGTTSTTYASVWSITTVDGKRAITNNGRSIRYYNNNFSLFAPSVYTAPYSIQENGSGTYLAVSGTSITYSTTESKIWNFSSMSGNTTISTTINNTTYYLNNTRTQYNSRGTATLTTSSLTYTWGGSTDEYTLTISGSGNYRKLAYDNNYRWHFARYSGSNYLTISGTPDSSEINIINSPASGTVSGPDTKENTSRETSSYQYSATNTTYFPLNVASDGGSAAASLTNGDYAPTSANTGYVIAGSSIDNEGTISSGKDLSSIRVSSYAKTNSDHHIRNSFKNGSSGYSNGTIANADLRTVNASGNVALTHSSVNLNDFEKFNDSKDSLITVLRSSANNYGLHFMNSEISKEQIVPATNISILGQTYSNPYQLPVNSIDFNLKEKGYINFFAGTYFTTDVTCFFSLHQIVRNEDTTIAEIKEIAEIYGNKNKKNYSYIYKFKDGTYSKPYRFDGNGSKFELSADDTGEVPFVDEVLSNISAYTSSPYNYQKIFDTNWISNFNTSGNQILTLTQNYLYYFEVPVNQGEYCLGSVKGGVGGYLLYLDIGANAAKTERTIFYEHYKQSEVISVYPGGVALQTLPTTFSKEVVVLDISTEIDCSDSACVRILPGYKNVFTIDRDDGDVTLTRSNTTNAPPIHKGVNITLIHDSGSTTPIEVDNLSNEVRNVKQMTYYDYNVNMDELIVTVITDTATNGGSSYTRKIVQSTYAGHLVTETPKSVYTYDPENSIDQRDSMKIYRTETGVKYTVNDIINQSTLPINNSDISNTAIVSVLILQNGGAGYEETITLNAVVDENNTEGMYYVVDNYTVSIVPDGQEVIVTVKEFESGNVIYYGTTQVTGANQTITIAA